MPEFQCSPSRRIRTENNIRNDFIEQDISNIVQNMNTNKEIRREIQLEMKRQLSRSSRLNETEEQRQKRLEQQKGLSQTNRTRRRSEKQSKQHIHADENDPETLSSIIPSWPGPIPRELKETCLHEFLKQMSILVLAEVCCAVCNIRAAARDSKTIPSLRIPNVRSLKIAEELKDIIQRSNESRKIFNNHNTETLEDDQRNDACNLCNFRFLQL